MLTPHTAIRYISVKLSSIGPGGTALTLRKKVLFYALLALFTLAALEGMGRLAYYFAFAEGYFPPPPEFSADAAGLELGAAAGIEREGGEELQRAARISHPYYGFTASDPTSPLNGMPPPQTGPDTVVLGLLGGSLAWEVTPYLQRALTRYFTDRGLDKDPQVIPLAYPRMKQPQQLNIVSFMLAMGGDFDILVNLDGWNELYFAIHNFERDIFPFFPNSWEYLVFLTQEEIALVAQIRTARAQLAQLRGDGAASPLRYTALYGMLHRYRVQQTETRVRQLNYELSDRGRGRSIEQQGPYVPFRDAGQVHQEAARSWYRSSVILDAVSDRAGADYYHFLQPNQYIPDAKPLSPQERQQAFDPEWAGQVNFAETYPMLVRFGQELQRQGINYFDLAHIFNDHPETLYRDICCHLNPRGNELLAAAMVERMGPALARRATVTVEERGGVLAVAAPRPLVAAGATPAAAAEPSVGRDAAGTKPDYQVSRRPGNLLLYVKNDCHREHTAASFLLHITPAEAADLPPRYRSRGFVNEDFLFAEGGIRNIGTGGRVCVIERRLPDYPIARIRTGQYNAAGEIWSAELSFLE